MTALVTLTALSWHGELPIAGQYLKSARGRTAYLVVEIVRPLKPCGHVARFRCERHPVRTLPEDAVVYGWKWSARS